MHLESMDINPTWPSDRMALADGLDLTPEGRELMNGLDLAPEGRELIVIYYNYSL